MAGLVKYPSRSLRYHHALPSSPSPLLRQQLPCRVNSGAIKAPLPQASGSGAFHNADGFFSVSSWLPLCRNHLFPAHHCCLNAAKHQKQENDGAKAWSLLFAWWNLCSLIFLPSLFSSLSVIVTHLPLLSGTISWPFASLCDPAVLWDPLWVLRCQCRPCLILSVPVLHPSSEFPTQPPHFFPSLSDGFLCLFW